MYSAGHGLSARFRESKTSLRLLKFSTDHSKAAPLLQFFFVYVSVVSYVAFLLSLFHYENTPIKIY